MNIKKSVIALGAIVLGTVLFGTAPARAITGCVPVTNLSVYPSQSGHLYNCMPTPQSQPEANYQQTLVGTVNAGVQAMGTANKKFLSDANTRFYVFYTGQQAFSQLGIVTGPGEPAVKPTETGRSWADPSAQPSLLGPTTAIFAYTAQQWAANGNHYVPSSATSAQTTNTTHHEIGHHMDRRWGQARQTPLPAITLSDPKWSIAINYDAASISTADRNAAKLNWPRLFFDGTTNWNPNEVFAVAFGQQHGGGTNAAEDTWVKNNFSCASWYIFYLASHGGAQPATLSGIACHGHTN